jgi:hypothetical protein
MLVAGIVLSLAAGTGAAGGSTSKARVRVAGVTKRTRPLCPPRGHGRVLLKDPRAVVFIRPESSGPYGGGNEIYGCTYAERKPHYIGLPAYYSSSGSGGVKRETLAGTMVAYENSGSAPESSPY